MERERRPARWAATLSFVGVVCAAACAGAPSPPPTSRPRDDTKVADAGAAPLVKVKKVTVLGQTRRFGALELIASYELTSERKSFGGLSGLTFSRDGERLFFISDRGRFFSARVEHDPRGALRSLTQWREGKLLDAQGKAFEGMEESDAESLTQDAKGRLFVGFEKHHRILLYGSGFRGRPKRVSLPAGVKLPYNGGLEAMAFLPGGRLLALSETAKHNDGTLRGWIGERRGDGAFRWSALSYVQHEEYRPTSAAALPTGDVIVLERFFSPLAGLRSKLRRIEAADLKAGARLDPRELGRIERGLVDNFEGIAVRYDPTTKRTRLYIVSDDNFNALQRTLLYQFVLLEP